MVGAQDELVFDGQSCIVNPNNEIVTLLPAFEESVEVVDIENYEQVELNIEQLGDQANFLQDGMSVSIESYEGSVLGVSLPEHVILEVVETEPVLKGQTAAASYKPALLENDVRSSVPPFIGVGDRVVVATNDGSYVKRADT